MPNASLYCVLLDANVWVAERLLQSSIGSALLYALTEASTFIVLPQVVELEVNQVLRNAAESAVDNIAKEARLLRQLSGQKLSYSAPTPLAVSEGIDSRWRQLEGTLRRVPFSQEHARSALNRVIAKLPPSGQNNEQFRDCCIWEAALEVARDRPVNLVTYDQMFYDGRDRAGGLASALGSEIATSGRDIKVYPTVRDFLTATDKTVAVDEAKISAAILEAVTPRASEIASDQSKHELGRVIDTSITGYATPRPSVVAVSFEVSFDVGRREPRSAERGATLTVQGVCSYNPTAREVSEIEVRQWSMWLNESHGTMWTDPQILGRQFSSSHSRLIS